MIGSAESLDSLHRLRLEIEEVDRRILGLVAERVRLARLTGPLKTAAGLPQVDPAREAAVVRQAGAVARAAGVPDEEARALLWQLIGICRQVQAEESR